MKKTTKSILIASLMLCGTTLMATSASANSNSSVMDGSANMRGGVVKQTQTTTLRSQRKLATLRLNQQNVRNSIPNRSQVVDVSSFQSKNLGDYKNQGAQAAVVKLSQGITYYNPKAADQIQSAKDNDMMVQAYHFSDFGTDISVAHREAAHAIANAQLYGVPAHSYIACDYENDVEGGTQLNNFSTSDKGANTRAIMAFMDDVKAAGYQPLLYTGQAFGQAYINLQDIVNRYGSCLWIANYATMDPVNGPDFHWFPSMNGVVMWQYTSNWYGESTDASVNVLPMQFDQPVTPPVVQKHTVTINYQYQGQTKATDQVTGDAGSTVQYSPNDLINSLQSQGFDITGANVNGPIHIGDGDSTITIPLKAKTVTVNASDPHDAGSYINGSNGVRWPAGLGKDDLTRNVSRTIQYEDENGNKVADDNFQNIQFTKSATVNEATGDVQYSNWSPDQGSFTTVANPKIDGMTTKDQSVGGTSVDVNSSSQVITIRYNKVIPPKDYSAISAVGATLNTDATKEDALNGQTYDANAIDKDGKVIPVTVSIPDLKTDGDKLVAGNYQVNISADNGKSISVPLQVDPAPAKPVDQSVLTASDATINVGDELPVTAKDYNVKSLDKDGKESPVNINIENVAQDNGKATTAGNYQVLITNEAGKSVTVALHVLAKPVTPSNPGNDIPDQTEYTLTAKYQDQNGDPIPNKNSILYTGVKGTKYTLDTSNVEMSNNGTIITYRFKSASVPVTGEITQNETAILTYVKTAIAPAPDPVVPTNPVKPDTGNGGNSTPTDNGGKDTPSNPSDSGNGGNTTPTNNGGSTTPTDNGGTKNSSGDTGNLKPDNDAGAPNTGQPVDPKTAGNTPTNDGNVSPDSPEQDKNSNAYLNGDFQTDAAGLAQYKKDMDAYQENVGNTNSNPNTDKDQNNVDPSDSPSSDQGETPKFADTGFSGKVSNNFWYNVIYNNPISKFFSHFF